MIRFVKPFPLDISRNVELRNLDILPVSKQLSDALSHGRLRLVFLTQRCLL